MGEIVGHILPKEFYRDMALFFQGMGQRTIDYHSTINGISNLLRYAVNDDGQIIANHSIPQEIIEQAHDELLATIDDRIFCMMHLVKINSFITHIIDKFGPVFRYEDPKTIIKEMPTGEWDKNVYCRFDFDLAAEIKTHNETTRVNFWEINLPVYCEQKVIWKDFEKLLSDGYTYLHSLRHLMSPKTIRNREDNICRDSYCTKFTYGRETTIEDTPSRTEYQYFVRTGFTLGLLQTSPKVAKWIATERKDSAHGKRIMNFLKTREYHVIFPGVWLKENRGKTHGITDMIKRQLAREIPGVIPQTEIFLGDVEQKPQTGIKPRLVHQ